MPKSVILALLKEVASIDLPEILVEVEKGIFKSDLSKLQTEIQETRYSSGQYKCSFCGDGTVRLKAIHAIYVAMVENHLANKLKQQQRIQRKNKSMD